MKQIIWKGDANANNHGPISAWLAINGINPDVVSVDHEIAIEGGHVYFTELLLNADGRKYPDETGDVARVNVRRPITVPF